MVQAIINISDETNSVLNVLKAKYGLKDKSQAIDQMAKEYELELLEPELRPEFVDRMGEIERERAIKVKDFAGRYGLKK